MKSLEDKNIIVGEDGAGDAERAFDAIGITPVHMDLIIVGKDMVAVDSVATSVMGIDPQKVKYLRSAEERGLGVSNPNNIEVLGDDIERKELRGDLRSL